MRYSLLLSANILDEREGSLDLNIMTTNMTDNEKFSVYINGEERCKKILANNDLDVLKENVGLSVNDSTLIKFYLEPAFHNIEIAFESNGP